ncbi:FkbM family methyltransferase [Paraburkholderia mimosarum]|uniref:FkbM family methyltransferase n=1 Tax=Paraburkholderia mimosarum TaxID=312026 RepID=UPI0039C0DA5E
MVERNRSTQSVKAQLKKILRPFAKAIYRCARPFVRPVAHRTRTFFTAGLRDDLERIQSQLEQIRHAALDENRAHFAGLHHAMQNVQDAYIDESRACTAGLHQAIQASRETILEEFAAARMQPKKQLFQELSGMVSRLDRIEQFAYSSARRVAVHSESGTVLLKSQVGYVLCSDSDHAVLAGLLDCGELERGTRLLIERFLAPEDVFVDVGAHLGLLSLAAARAMQGRGKIIAFEPFPETRKLMERSFWINGLSRMLELHEVAVSDHNGTSTLFLGEVSGHHSIFALNEAGSEAAPKIEVDLVTLDSVVPPDQRVTLIKIDVEGAELDVIKGASATLQRNPDTALIAEFGPPHLRRSIHTVDDWLATFEKLGYLFRRINVETGELEAVTRDELVAADSTNMFFARPTAPAWKKLGVNL